MTSLLSRKVNMLNEINIVEKREKLLRVQIRMIVSMYVKVAYDQKFMGVIAAFEIWKSMRKSEKGTGSCVEVFVW